MLKISEFLKTNHPSAASLSAQSTEVATRSPVSTIKSAVKLSLSSCMILKYVYLNIDYWTFVFKINLLLEFKECLCILDSLDDHFEGESCPYEVMVINI